jgi:hypothetical protein
VEKEKPKTLSEDEKKKISDCFKKDNCEIKETMQMCPWAESEQTNPTADYTPEEKKEIDNICVQCEQIAIIACGRDFDEAQQRFNIFADIFLSDRNKDKPLIFGFTRPNFRFSNLNINDNITKIESDRANYISEYENLMSDLKKLSDNVPSEAVVTSNVKAANNLISGFENRWTLYFNNIEKLKDLFRRSNSVLIDWNLRIAAKIVDPYCSGYKPQFELAARDSGNLSAAFQKAVEVINKSNTRYNLAPLASFTENAIKLRYVQTSKTRLEDLEKSLGAVLRLDSDLMQANTWWYKTSLGGLADGLHTRYYQYREPLRLLTMAAAKGQSYIDLIKGNSTAPTSAVTRAVTTQQQRIKQIENDISWLKSRGWEGQFADQKLTAQSWQQVAKTQVCRNALKAFMDGAAKVTDDLRDFESFAEPKFLDAMKVCEAAE